MNETRRNAAARLLSALGALTGWTALTLQFALLVRQLGQPLLATWRYLGFFTILSNLLIALTLTHAVLLYPRRRGLGAPAFELAAATAIAMVGLVYTVLLRATWNPQGAQKLADTLLHDVAPVIFVAYFLVRPRPPMHIRDSLTALVFPLAYVVYALARGALDGWYAYWFLDPHKLGATQMALSVIALAAAFFAMALLLAFLSNRLNARSGNARATLGVEEVQ